MFLTQLRAILRASHYGKVRHPDADDRARARDRPGAALRRRWRETRLAQSGIPYDREVPVGGMIEVPAAALAVASFMRKLDFLSIGTNDLIQYTLAIDRTDDTVAHLYDPLHPAVLFLVAHTIRAANKAGVPVARLRRDGGRARADAAAARAGAAPVLDASGAAARR